jgi:hypothetical protein
MRMQTRLTAAFGVLICGLTGSVAEAATIPITWGTPTTISGDSDVRTIGTLFRAVSFGDTDDTTEPGAHDGAAVNGVTFDALNAPKFDSGGMAGPLTSGNVTLTKASAGANLFGTDAAGSSTGTFAGLTTAYKDLLSHYNFGDALRTISISNLAVDQQYELQIFYNDSRANFGGTTTYDSDNPKTLDGHTGNNATAGGVGEWVTGTFTPTLATGTTQTFTVGTINAIQIRAVPEPSAFAAIAVGGLGLLARRRRAAAC